jgi:hypothetical protein
MMERTLNTFSNHRTKYRRRFSVLTVALLYLALTGCETAEEAQIEALKSKVVDRLIDPESAKFRKLTLLAGDKGLCGEVNAKNRSGGYTGFAAFAVKPSGESVILKALTLDIAQENYDRVMEYAVALSIGGNSGQSNLVTDDMVNRKSFDHWKECVN